MVFRIVGVLGTVVMFLAIVGVVPGGKASPTLAQSSNSSTPFRGAGSCSAAACHGDSKRADSKILRNEHTTWIKHDRHADAFAVLFDERSRSISANLSGGLILADQDTRCLACHAPPLRESTKVGVAAIQREGVGCESCHGPADRWIGPHTRWDWAGRTPEDKERFGMIDLSDLPRRARSCASCHVGEPAREGRPAREVGHEMIAAGHPRLNFEFSAYQATMARHWRDDVGPDSTADFPARAWTVGQLASAKAAVDLLSDRALRSRPQSDRSDRSGDRKADWPELSEYACYSCHHDLRDESWRRSLAGKQGSPRWGSWHSTVLEGLVSGPDFSKLNPTMRELQKLMDQPRPDPIAVGRVAGEFSAILDHRLRLSSGLVYDAKQVDALLSSVMKPPDREVIESWDDAAQRYLALVPLTQALRSLNPASIDLKPPAELKRLRDLLRFPAGSDSPKSFNPTRLPTLLVEPGVRHE